VTQFVPDQRHVDRRRLRDFIRRRDVLTPSADGPAFLLDRHRRTRRGGHVRARAVLRRLHDHGVDLTITVLTAASLAYPDEIRFYVENGITSSFVNVESEGPNVLSLAAHGTDERFRCLFAFSTSWRRIFRSCARVPDRPGCDFVPSRWHTWKPPFAILNGLGKTFDPFT
jgi:hypothetical protein